MTLRKLLALRVSPKTGPRAKLLVQSSMRSLDQLDEQEKQHVDLLIHAHPKVHTTVELARQFAVMVRHQQAHLLDEWLEKAIVSQVPSLRSFALGIQQDESAVRAALSLQWSNGPTEGPINRLKSLHVWPRQARFATITAVGSMTLCILMWLIKMAKEPFLSRY